MNEIAAEFMAIFDSHEYIKAFVKENFEPVEDKPGYVWFSKRNFQIIDIETFVKFLEEGWTRGLYNSPFAEKERDEK